MLEAALSPPGLARVAELAAEAASGTVAIIIPRVMFAIAPEHARASADAETLAAWVCARTRGGPAAVPDEVLAEAPIRFRDGVVGIVALLRGQRPPHPDASEYLHLATVAALAAVAVDHATAETEERLRTSLLEELRCQHALDGAEIVRRAVRLGCDLSAGGVVLSASLRSRRPRLVEDMIAAEHPGAIAEQVAVDHGDAGPEFLLYAVLPAGEGGGASLMATARRLASRLRPYALVGISSYRSDPAELGEAFREAELVLEVLKRAGGTIAHELGDGTYRLLFRLLASHPEEVLAFYETTIAAIANYDDRYGTDLLATLMAYLDANCNMNATAATIFAHRHTVAYRLERVRELTGLDPMLSEHREQLGLGLKVHRIVGVRN